MALGFGYMETTAGQPLPQSAPPPEQCLKKYTLSPTNRTPITSIIIRLYYAGIQVKPI